MLSRRDFLTHSAAAAALLTLPPDVRPSRRRRTCVVLDLGEHCALRESLLGYSKASCHPEEPLDFARGKLRDEGPVLVGLDKVQIPRFARNDITIIPAATHIEPSTAQLALNCLRQGGTVLLESGAMFGDHWEHREQLRNYFQILLKPPVDLWPARGIPYVEYSWPIATKVRDFSRVLPLARQRGTMIAKVNEIPVALTRRVGSGILIFLGSPLGPALWAGDTEAKRWLHSLLALGAHRQT